MLISDVFIASNLNALVKSLTLSCTYLLKQSLMHWLILNTIKLAQVFLCILSIILKQHLDNLEIVILWMLFFHNYKHKI